MSVNSSKELMRFYRDPRWISYREAIIEADGGFCQNCSRSRTDGAILQVHHKVYRVGLPPWDYPPADCVTLCKRCHAVEHSKIFPISGWELIGHEDLGDLIGACELCGTELRYEFHIEHPKWFPMIVGTNCCDYLTESEVASGIRRDLDRQKRFIDSKRWKSIPEGFSIRQMQMDFQLHHDRNGYLIRFMGKSGKKRFETLESAKEGLFSFIEKGGAAEFYRKQIST